MGVSFHDGRHRVCYSVGAEMTTTVSRARLIRAECQALIIYIRENEEDAAFIEYCEGILQAARAALGVISGD